ELQPAGGGLAAGASAQRRADHARLRPGHPAGDAAADLVGAAHGPVAAAPGAAHLGRGADPGGGTADDRRTVADARAGAARRARGPGLQATAMTVPACIGAGIATTMNGSQAQAGG